MWPARTAIKGQALADFIVEFTYADTTEVARTTNNVEAVKEVETWNGETSVTRQEDADQWILYVDGTSNENGSGARMMLISPGHCALRFGFSESNNKAEYEALIVGLHLVKELRAHHLKIYSDSQLIVNKVNDIYLVRGQRMAAYLEKAKGLMKTIPIASIEVIPQSKNTKVDALAKLASMKEGELLDAVLVEFLAEPRIKQQPEVMELVQEPSWMDPIIAYFK